MRRTLGSAVEAGSRPRSTSPNVPADTPSSRVAYSTKSAQKTKLKKLIVAVARSVVRTTADAAIQRSPTVTPLSSSSGRRLLGVDSPEERAGPEERQGVEEERPRRGQRLDEEPGHRGAGDERECAAAVEQRARLDEALAGHDRLEERRVGDAEQHGHRSRDEREA
jgi:hypothetical protein